MGWWAGWEVGVVGRVGGWWGGGGPGGGGGWGGGPGGGGGWGGGPGGGVGLAGRVGVADRGGGGGGGPGGGSVIPAAWPGSPARSVSAARPSPPLEGEGPAGPGGARSACGPEGRAALGLCRSEPSHSPSPSRSSRVPQGVQLLFGAHSQRQDAAKRACLPVIRGPIPPAALAASVQGHLARRHQVAR